MWRSRLVGGVVALGVLGTACVSDNPSEPGLRSVTTDLQYQSIRDEAAAPPNIVPSTTVQEEDFPTPRPFAFGDRELGPVAPPVQVCPTPSPADQPSEDVPESVTGVPRAGTYLWRVDGGEKLENFTISFAEFHRRSVGKVKGSAQQAEPDVSFETVERELSGTDPNPPFIRQTFESNTAGVYLTSIVREVPGEEGSREFHPINPIQYLPTPVLIGPGSAWTSESVDVLSEGQPQVLNHRAYVKGRMTIDACGERIRAWHVVSRQTFTSGASRVARRYEYGVANQLGGLVIYERVQSPCDEEPVPSGGAAAPECDPEPTLVFQANLGKFLEE